MRLLSTLCPFNFLAYHVAVLKGTDVDQPRNLAKSVTNDGVRAPIIGQSGGSQQDCAPM